MATVATLAPTRNLTVSYARLYGALEGYAVRTPTALVFVDHDGHVYALPPDQAHAVCDLGAVPAVEWANVLQAVSACEAVDG